jgi:hypothetical protein
MIQSRPAQQSAVRWLEEDSTAISDELSSAFRLVSDELASRVAV